jgi:hypothetical protein
MPQWPLTASHTCGAVQPVDKQPGTQVPPEQMLAGAPTHSESVLQPALASGRSGHVDEKPSQQRPLIGSQRKPGAQNPLTVQPATHDCVEVRHTRSGGSQSLSMWQTVDGPPLHSPVCASQVAAAGQASGLATQPGTQRPSALQTVAGGAQSLEKLQVSEPTSVV